MSELSRDPLPAEPLEHPSDWGLMTRLLTLDLTSALRSYLDLHVSDHDALVAVLRDAVRAQPQIDPAGPSETLGIDALAMVDARLGREEAQAWVDFGNDVFRFAFRENRRYSYWSLLLGQCRWDESMWQALSVPSRQRAVFTNRFLNAQEDSRFMADLHRAMEGQMTPWDLQMKLDDAFGDEGSEPSVPEMLLSSLAAGQRTREFWRWVSSALSAAEQRELVDSARAVVRSRTELSFIEELLAPAELAGPTAVVEQEEA
ncbi:MAG: hypothetical protein K0V04_41050 [Deltaproteobacteria bacterium]|nr:hypothetical protein [Deltaproteobacteria bacterium]